MKHFKILAAGAAFAVLATGATGVSAQTIGIGTTKGGAAASMATAIAKAVSSNSKFQMRTQKMGGTQQYIPVVNAGELEFGVSNIMQLGMAYTGTGLSQGKDYSNVRMAATLMEFAVGLFATEESGITRLEQLKGQRLPGGFKASPLMKMFMDVFLEGGGIKWSDVTAVPYVGLRQHWTGFKQGKINVGLAAVGSGATREIAAKVPFQWIDIKASAAQIAAVNKALPGAVVKVTPASKKLPGLKKAASAIYYDYTLFTNAKASDEAVYEAVKGLHAGVKEVKATSPLWRTFNAKRMPKKQSIPHHPGAIKYYKEAGLM